jgi:prepilin peptidase CpaA
LHHLRLDLLAQSASYKFYIEAATVAVLCYVGYTDFRTFRIPNGSVLLLLMLYALYALPLRPHYVILSNVVFSIVIFGVMLYCYARKLVGGGDVKLLAVACMWTGIHCALVFSVAVLVFIGLHVTAVKSGWIAAGDSARRGTIAYAPSVAGALIGAILLGCI